MALTFTREPADTPEALALLTARDAESNALYPPEANFGIPVNRHGEDAVLFHVLREDGVAIGCGALELHDGYAELKSVFVTPAARGRRLGQEITRRLEEVARTLGFDLLRLETGNRSPWAVRTYERAGYHHCARFGAYPENAYSIYMAKHLGASHSHDLHHETGGDRP
jgi:putative acetyltransferase